MAWSFRRRLKIIPGVYLNFSKSGLSTTIGPRGASINFGKNGTYLNTGIPGTGLYNRTRLDGPKGGDYPQSSSYNLDNKPSLNPLIQSDAISKVEKFISLEANQIVSHDLVGIKEAIVNARNQRQDLYLDIAKIEKDLRISKLKLTLSYICLIGFFVKKLRNSLKNDIVAQSAAKQELQLERENSFVELQANFDDGLDKNFNDLVSSFDKLSKSNKIWDITESYEQNRITTRSAASSIITRKEVQFEFSSIEEIKSQRPVFCMHNANGAQLHFYPFFLILNNGTQDFGFLDYKDLHLDFKSQRFVEDQRVPEDSEVIDTTWAKVNKNGSPDRRFTGNYQIPVVQYGEMYLSSNNGLNECYSFSNFQAAKEFANTFIEFQKILNSLERKEGHTEHLSNY